MPHEPPLHPTKNSQGPELTIPREMKLEIYAVPKWHALIGSPAASISRELRLFRVAGDLISEVQPFVLKEIEGNPVSDSEPLFRGSMIRGLGDEMESFLRAIVEVAAENGIYASGTKDITRELTAVRDHLADMRTLALKTSA